MDDSHNLCVAYLAVPVLKIHYNNTLTNSPVQETHSHSVHNSHTTTNILQNYLEHYHINVLELGNKAKQFAGKEIKTKMTNSFSWV